MHRRAMPAANDSAASYPVPPGEECFPIWQSPDFVPWQSDPATPIYAHCWPELLAQCEAALTRRQESYPAMIARRDIDADLAAADIAAWAALVAEWRWICTGTGELPPRHTLKARIAACDLARERIDQQLARAGRNLDVLRQAHLVMALRWHLTTEKYGDPAVHFWAGFNHRTRAALAACPTCELASADPRTRACTRTDCGLPARDATQTKERTAA